MCHFRDQNGTFVMNNFFFVQTFIITFILLLGLFIEYSGSRVTRMRNIWAQNGPFLQMRIFFFRKPVNEPCFFHLCLSKRQKSKSDINLFVKYWQLKNEISLAERHFWLKLENQIFPKHAVFAECLWNILHKFQTSLMTQFS